MDVRRGQALRDRIKDKSLIKEAAYIAGKWVKPGPEVIEVTNPADGATIAVVPRFGRQETREAIAAAEKARPGWAAKTAKERAAILRKWFNLIIDNQEDLAQIMTAEQGKPLAEARGEVVYGASFIEFFAEEGKRLYGETVPSPFPNARIVVIRQPVGVVAAITPWNFPNAMITRKAGPALAAGCTMVVKPASETPLSALALAELGERAGIPPGVLNVLTGSARDIGGELTASPLVRMLTFTGSTAVGKVLLEQCAGTVKKVGMELGGNAPFIVFDDADLDAAVAGAMASKYRNAGQTCVCANRILVQDKVYDAFAEKLRAAVAKMKVGPGTEDGVTTGPLINKAAVEKVEEHIADALAKGAKLVAGGKSPRRQLLRADDPARCHPRHGGCPRGDLRPGGAALPLRHRGRGDRHGQRHRVRPRLLFLHAATSAASGGSARRWNTASSASMKGSSRPRRRLSAGSRNPASDAKGRITAWMNSPNSNTC